MTVSANFARSVNRVLAHRHMSINAAARAWGVPQKTLEAVVKQTRTPSLDTAEKIAKSADYKLWQMLTDNFDPSNPPMLMPITPQEREFHERLQALMRTAPVAGRKT